MQIKTSHDVPSSAVTAFGSEHTSIQWFRTPEESTHFMLRRFEIGPHGHIGIHQHPEEHQMFILVGPIHLLDEHGTETLVESNQFVYMPPNEPHGYRNRSDHTVSFLCGIPKL